MEYIKTGSGLSLKDEDILPSLETYKKDHSLLNLQKLCVEISEFLRDVYASTKSDEEREVYRQMLERLKR